MNSNFTYQSLRGVGRGAPAGVSIPVEGYDEHRTVTRAPSPHHLVSAGHMQRFTVPTNLSRTPVKQSVPKSYVGVSTDDETDFDEPMSSDEHRQRRQSGFGCRPSNPADPAPAFQRNSRVYRSFGGFGSNPVARPAPPRGIMRTPKPPAVTQEVLNKMVGREEPARDNGGSKLHPSAP
uniref:Uncharacterized protein n=1 Tax=Plectus sambesii TaxID=2011161 RepID=A0A914UKM1_9BILA